MKFHHVAAACVMSAALLAGVAPAGAALVANALVANALTLNALASNALAAGGSAIADRNGVAVEAVSRDRIDGVEPNPGDKTAEIVLDQWSQVDPGSYR